jgi:hypothetical protein
MVSYEFIAAKLRQKQIYCGKIAAKTKIGANVKFVSHSPLF